jgi:hypothetical protein
MVVDFPDGGYRFIAAPGRPFSAGAAAAPGFGLTRVRLLRAVPLAEGLAQLQRHLDQARRPAASVASFELRVPAPMTAEGFAEFNRGYVERLRALGVAAGEHMPAARTNVAPSGGAVAEPCLYAFTYTAPQPGARAAFRISGSTETVAGSPAARIASILDELEARMAELGVAWRDATFVNLYAASELGEALLAELSRRVPVLHGFTWYPSLPPVTGADFEIDTGAMATEIVV